VTVKCRIGVDDQDPETTLPQFIETLAGAGVYVNAVFACPHYANGKPPYNVADHPARKPNPGMLLAAAEMMPITLSGSWIIGDRSGDIEAAKRAGCAGGVHVLSGHGSEPGERTAALAARTVGFDVKVAKSIKDAGALIPMLVRLVATVSRSTGCTACAPERCDPRASSAHQRTPRIANSTNSQRSTAPGDESRALPIGPPSPTRPTPPMSPRMPYAYTDLKTPKQKIFKVRFYFKD